MTICDKKFELALANSGLKMIQLAEKSGVGIATIARIRSGCHNCTPSTVGKIAKALEVPVESIIK